MMNQTIDTRLKITFILLWAIVLSAALQLLPCADDWFIIGYMDRHEAWSITTYRWLNDNPLLIRGYWRPIEDVLYFWEGRNPWVFPWIQHLLVVTCAFATGWTAYLIGKKIGVPPRRMLITTCIAMPVATNMGALMSIDSLTQVMSAFWGLLSVYFYLSDKRYRYVMWILCGCMACMSKESGFIFFTVGPLLALAMDYSGCNFKLNRPKAGKLLSHRDFQYLLIGGIMCLLYLGIYFTMKNAWLDAGLDQPVQELIEHIGPTEDTDDGATEFLRTGHSHKLTPVTFVKNIAILYGLAIYPANVSSLYYGEYGWCLFSILLGWTGLALIVRMFRKAPSSIRRKAIAIACVAVVVSLPAMITRAGEISPFNSNMLFMIAVAMLASGYEFKRIDKAFIIVFIAITLVTDAYKYSLAYEGGRHGRDMAREVVALSPKNPGKVLWVGVDEEYADKAGLAFSRSAFRSFWRGAAAIAEYDYMYPRQLDQVIVTDVMGADQIVDSIANARLKDYDCVWITRGTDVRVLTERNSK